MRTGLGGEHEAGKMQAAMRPQCALDARAALTGHARLGVPGGVAGRVEDPADRPHKAGDGGADRVRKTLAVR